MTAHATASITYLHALFDYSRARGLDDARLLDGRALDLEDRDARLPEADCAALFDRAATLLRDDNLGLHAGEQIRPGHYGVLGYVVMNCATLGEALQQLRRYQALVLDIGAPAMQQQHSGLSLRWQHNVAQPYRQLAEFNLAALLSFVRWLTGSNAAPLGMDFTYPAPEDTAEHQRIFACPLTFARPWYEMRFAADWLQLPLLQPDPSMRPLMQRLAEQQLLGLKRGDDTLARARRQLARQLGEGDTELASLAQQLHISPRSLQRKLKEADLSFTRLLDEVRLELAERYLADARLSLTDIAFLLGFSEQSAFTRAFKRWHGCPPAQFRHGPTTPA